MPSLHDLLAKSMLFTGAKHRNLVPVPLSLSEGPFRAPKPNPQELADVDWRKHVETVLHNKIWRFRWDPGTPSIITDITIRSRGMGMDYGMEMPVYDRVEFGACKIVRPIGDTHELPLDAAHMLGAWWTREGRIPGNDAGLWRLEAKLDSSMLVAFGFQLTDFGIEPLSLADAEDLGEALMPPERDPPRLRFTAGDPAEAFVCVGPSRYIVVVELVLMKERPDFVPGDMIGFARIHPHALVWSNEELLRTEISITCARPSKTMGCGDPAMKDTLCALVVTDTNDWHSTSSLADKPVPYTDVLYDYYCVDPYHRFKNRQPRRARGDEAGDHILQKPGEITLADARFTAERTIDDAVSRRTKFVLNHRSIRKCRRQGQFDNVHVAARMKAQFVSHEIGSTAQDVTLDNIVMINQCFHDCVHMHVRWTEFIETKLFAGWGAAGPHSRPGVPGVPPNQTVFASFPEPSVLQYRAVAEGVKPGVVQVFCHHGMAYAVDAWPTLKAAGQIALLHTTVRVEAEATQDAYAGELPFGWLEFYWRVRWTGQAGAHVERLVCTDLERCMR